MGARRLLALALLALTAFSMVGCWDRRELEEQAFVLAIGLDKGKEFQYAVTVAIANPANLAGGGGGGGGGGQGPGNIITTVEAPTIMSAIVLINGYFDRALSLLQTKVMIMSEELARAGGMQAMDEFVRTRQTRDTILYVVSKDRVEDLLKNMKPMVEKDPIRFITGLTDQYRVTGTVPARSQIHHFVRRSETGYREPLAYYVALPNTTKGNKSEATGHQDRKLAGDLPRRGGPTPEMAGAAAFKGDRMVGTLSGREVRVVLLLQDQFRRGIYSVPDPKRPGLMVSIFITRGRAAHVSVDVSGVRPLIRAELSLEAEILGVQSGVDYSEPELKIVLENAIAQEITSRAMDVIKKTQDWETDVIGFGRAAVRNFPTVSTWEAYDWPSKYVTADAQVNVNVSIRRFGKRLSPPKEQ